MRHSLLIVDDEEFVRNALARALRSEEYEIRTADGPKAAWEALSERPADIILSDFKMPRMTGLELLQRVREQYPDSIRIMLTGHADTETVIDAVNNSEIYRFLTKPWNDDELKLMLRLAAAHLDTMRENRRLVDLVRRQAALLRGIEGRHPGITKVERSNDGAVVIDEIELRELIGNANVG
jgi:two-component system, probable response regulator PhcQ